MDLNFFCPDQPLDPPASHWHTSTNEPSMICEDVNYNGRVVSVYRDDWDSGFIITDDSGDGVELHIGKDLRMRLEIMAVDQAIKNKEI